MIARIHDGACALQNVQQKSEKISEMTAVMWQAANMEDRADTAVEVIAQLQRENHAMRELLQLELQDSETNPQTEAEMQKPPLSDVAIQTQSSPDDDPFCTGDFATIRPRPPSSSSRTPSSSERCSTNDDSRHSSYLQSPDNADGFPKSPPSSISPGNLADVSSSSTESSSNGVIPSLAVSSADSTHSADDESVSYVNSSESLETLVNSDELSADDEYL